MSENEPKPLSEEEQIQRDITSAKASLVSKETQDLIKKEKDAARLEAEKEFLVNQKVKELEEQNKRLQEEQTNKEKEAALKFEELQRKIGELTTSRAPIKNRDPFANEPSQENASEDVKNWSEDKINDIERASGIAFFGEDFERPL